MQTKWQELGCDLMAVTGFAGILVVGVLIAIQGLNYRLGYTSDLWIFWMMLISFALSMFSLIMIQYSGYKKKEFWK